MNKLLSLILDQDIHLWLDKKQNTPIEYFKSLKTIGLTLLFSIVSIILFFIIFINRHPINAKYFYATHDQVLLAREHKPFKMDDLNTSSVPNLSKEKIQDWITRVLTSTMTFNFSNIEDVISNSEFYFSNSGFTYYKDALNKSKIIDTVTKKRLVSNLTVLSPPIFTEEPVLMGDEMIWSGIEVHAIITYTGASQPYSDKILFKIVAIQTKTWNNPQGLEIQSITSEHDNSQG